MLSITASDPLSITGGSLIVAADSTIGGGLTMTGGLLEASGTGVLLTVTGTTTVSVANLNAAGGATLALPGLTSYSGGAAFFTSTLQASGSGSLLSLPALATLTASTAQNSLVRVNAVAAGDVELPALTQVTGPVALSSTNAGSTLDVSDLSSLTGNGGSESLTITQGGTVTDPNLTTFANATITTDPTATFSVPANETFSFPNSTTTITTVAQNAMPGFLREVMIQLDGMSEMVK